MSSNQHNEAFDVAVRQCTSRHIARWERTPGDVPDFNTRFTSRQQLENEKKLESQFDAFPSSLEAYEGLQEEDRVRLHTRVKRLMVGLPFFAQNALGDDFFQASEAATGSFVRAAREFDPSISENDILQALRNLWVFNSIQVILGQPVSLTPSSLAYSLLYPFTDNGLDSDSRTEDEKGAFLQWLTLWFEGSGCEGVDDWSIKVGRLLGMIEEEYPRPVFPNVYLSLSAIHQAQRRSLLLRDILSEAPETDLLAITIEKGGTSVLVDGYLASPQLSAPLADVLFGYGVVLQLIDDLQDLGEDRRAGYSSPFLRALERGQLDEATHRLIHFTRHWSGKLKDYVRPSSASIQKVIEGSCIFLIAEAVGRYREMYSKSLVRSLERSVPFRLDYLAEVQRSLKKRRARQPELSKAETEIVVT